MGKESKLKEITLSEEDWISGSEKDKLKDYEEVLAFDGKNFFKAYLNPVQKKYLNGEIINKRIWQNSETRGGTTFISEDYVQSYIKFDKLKKSLPKIE